MLRVAAFGEHLVASVEKEISCQTPINERYISAQYCFVAFAKKPNVRITFNLITAVLLDPLTLQWSFCLNLLYTLEQANSTVFCTGKQNKFTVHLLLGTH